jgi:hypothetical protein
VPHIRSAGLSTGDRKNVDKWLLREVLDYFSEGIPTALILSVVVVSVSVMSFPFAALDAVQAVDPMLLSDAVEVAALVELERQARRLPGCRHLLVAEIDACGVAETARSTSRPEGRP